MDEIVGFDRFWSRSLVIENEIFTIGMSYTFRCLVIFDDNFKEATTDCGRGQLVAQALLSKETIRASKHQCH